MIVGKYMNYESLPGQTFMNDVVDNFFFSKEKKIIAKLLLGPVHLLSLLWIFSRNIFRLYYFVNYLSTYLY